jgi:type VI secretion system secreted protein VgrG
MGVTVGGFDRTAQVPALPEIENGVGSVPAVTGRPSPKTPEPTRDPPETPARTTRNAPTAVSSPEQSTSARRVMPAGEPAEPVSAQSQTTESPDPVSTPSLTVEPLEPTEPGESTNRPTKPAGPTATPSPAPSPTLSPAPTPTPTSATPTQDARFR